ncbi:AbiH family protein [Flavobacterium weaverense]|uniref:Abortive infection AbiH-like protein n=1 Tax=Flavobacterium weaverense TaxID=271156 RepID=A0A3M0ADH7_9FLAO|nr:AbiH family protein [Flavobacterium weaverense]RMA77202.1 abortive infection AbiH-like protein [Flavobacterium weaverense]
MNRLIIIGNGFDLAHGLPTSYKDFIDDYWKNIKSSSYEDEFISFQNFAKDFKFDEISNLVGLSKLIIENDGKIKFESAEIYREHGNNLTTGKYPREDILVYKNDFFKLINQKNVENWVDIENEYFILLKKIIKSEHLKNYVSKEFLINEQKIQTEKLNKEFEQVKILLEKYLNDRVLNVFDLQMSSFSRTESSKLQKLITPIGVSSNKVDLLQEFHEKDHKEIEDQLKESKELGKNNSRVHILNFNYSRTPIRYTNNTANGIEVNFIHGVVGDKDENKINFGFGDEMDEDYKLIENINDNEYLRNFKSFLYLQNSNYKSLLDFIENDKFQIYIMGHSCGLSDRTLLNTVFENDNCRSIKVFYHKRQDGTDNYTELIQNISRHFNKKKLMREKIVNKTLCQPLPQIQLPRFK